MLPLLILHILASSLEYLLDNAYTTTKEASAQLLTLTDGDFVMSYLTQLVEIVYFAVKRGWVGGWWGGWGAPKVRGSKLSV